MKFEFIKHSDVNDEILNRIACLKNKQWNYSTSQHLQWINENILHDDIHVIMSDNTRDVAYMNLVEIKVLINNSDLSFLGIGNVCAIEKGKGYGKEILVEVNIFLKNNNNYGILLCKDNLVKFYSKYDWELVNKIKVQNPRYIETNIMTFNFEKNIDLLDYNGRNF